MKFFQWALIALTFALAGAVVAQERGITPLQGIIGAQSGKYEFFQYDKGLLQKTYLDKVFERSKEDREFFLKSVTDLEKSFEVFLNDVVFREGGLVTMNQNAKLMQASDALEFMKAINRYHKSRLELEARIEALTAITDGRLPSQLKIKADGSGIEEAPNYGNIDLTPMKKFYLGRVEYITQYLENLQQIVEVKDKTGKVLRKIIIAENTKKGLQLPAAPVLLTPAEILQLRNEILEASQWNTPESVDACDAFTKYIRQYTQDFISTYGSTERYRRLSDDEKAKRADDAKQLVEAFWLRSYIRAAYGMPIAAIGLDYDKYPFHLDVILNSTKSLALFHEQPVWRERDFIRQEQNFRNALKRANVRSEKIMDGNLGFIASGENLLTWLGGQRNMAQALQMMLQLMAADLYEERLVQKADGVEKMKARFRTRYASNDADKKFYRDLRMAYDPPGGGVPLGVNKQSLNGKFQELRNHLLTKDTERKLAEEKQAQIEIATGANRFAAEREKRIDDLFGKD